MINVTKKNHICFICQKATDTFINLKEYPITEIYLDANVKDDQNKSQLFFLDQQYNFCSGCNHAFLENIIDIRYVYQNYWTTTSVSAGAVECLRNFSQFINTNIKNIEDYKNFIDIGGNDSTFFNLYKDTNINKINIDPNASGPNDVTLIKEFFDDFNLDNYKNSKKIIVSSHTIEHLENPRDLIEKISVSMNDDDDCFLQFPSIEKQVEHLRFDQITHQHLNLFSINSINKLLSQNGLFIVSYEYDLSLYGTLRVHCKKIASKNLQIELLDSINFINSYDIFKNYYQNLNKAMYKLDLKFNGFGAGLMVPTLSYNLDYIKENIEFIYEDNIEKHNKKYPGLKAKIVSTNNMQKNENIIVTSISTKISNRNILKLLDSKGILNIINPVFLN